MMQRKYLVLLIALAVALFVGAAVIVYIVHVSHGSKSGFDRHQTNSHVVFEEETPTADPAIVGRWQNKTNPQWFRVYYDDYDGDGFFWGKEWDEADDVHEVDLNYHGNGWFRWRKDGTQLLEMHTMDVQDVPIPKRWKVHTKSLPDSLTLISVDVRNQCLRFGRVQ